MRPDECAAFDAANPQVWRLFCRYAWGRWHAQEEQGVPPERRRFSARVIIGKIRWDAAVKTKPDATGLKINDHMSTYYARKFMERYPALDGFFQLRGQPLPLGHWPRPGNVQRTSGESGMSSEVSAASRGGGEACGPERPATCPSGRPSNVRPAFPQRARVAPRGFLFPPGSDAGHHGYV